MLKSKPEGLACQDMSTVVPGKLGLNPRFLPRLVCWACHRYAPHPDLDVLNDPLVAALDSVRFGSYAFVSSWVKLCTVGHGMEGGGSGGIPASGGLVDLWIKLDEVNIRIAIVWRRSSFHRAEYPRSDCPFSIHRVMNWKAQFDTLVYTICKIEK